MDGKLDGAGRSALLKPVNAVGLLQAGNDRFFDDRLAVGDAVQLGFQRPAALDREGILAADVVLEGDFAYPLEQLLKVARLKPSQHQLHPLSGAQADVGAGNQILVPVKGDAAVGDLHVFAAHPADLGGQNALQPKVAGSGQCYFQLSILLFSRSVVYGCCWLYDTIVSQAIARGPLSFPPLPFHKSKGFAPSLSGSKNSKTAFFKRR